MLPVVAAFLPFDAVAAIMDGSLLGAGDTGYLGRTMLVTGSISMAALYYVQNIRPGSSMSYCSLAMIALHYDEFSLALWCGAFSIDRLSMTSWMDVLRLCNQGC